jgi:type VI secretion system protein VasG
VLNAIAARCTEVESGARNVDNILTNTLLPEISNRILTMMATGEKQDHIAVSLTEDGNFAYN